MGRCKQKQRGLKGLLYRWPSITEWEVHIAARGSEMTYTVSSGTLNHSIPYHTIPYRWLLWNVNRKSWVSDRPWVSRSRYTYKLNGTKLL